MRSVLVLSSGGKKKTKNNLRKKDDAPLPIHRDRTLQSPVGGYRYPVPSLPCKNLVYYIIQHENGYDGPIGEINIM